VEAALAEPRCFPLKKKIAPPHPTQKPPCSELGCSELGGSSELGSPGLVQL
jgi:hypothetical protein